CRVEEQKEEAPTITRPSAFATTNSEMDAGARNALPCNPGSGPGMPRRTPGTGRTGTMRLLTIVSAIMGLVCIAGGALLVFVSAQCWDLPLGWTSFHPGAAAAVIGPFCLDPELIRERLRPGCGRENLLNLSCLTPLCLGHYLLAGLDLGRLHWTDTV